MIADWQTSGKSKKAYSAENGINEATFYYWFYVNPFQWLKHTLLNIASINHKNLKDLYPQNFKNQLTCSS